MSAQKSLITCELLHSIGIESEPVTHEVERGAVMRFAEAIDDPNPVYRNEVAARKSRYRGIIAPPTFFRSLPEGQPGVNVQSPLPRVLDGGSEWEFFEPVRVGDRITVTTKLVDVTQHSGRLGPMIFIKRETKYVNQFSQLVATQRSTGISY